jgi:acyl-CoA synthetase (AMP-forming)/AMP-acid ligase II
VAAADPRVDQVRIVTPDKDLGQCVVGPRVVQYDRRKDEVVDEAAVTEKFGVPPSSIADYLALVGDTADGYPGLPGWGAKSAAAVLRRYGTIEAVPTAAADWDVALVDENDNPVPVGTDGELVVRPKRAGTMMLGYLNKPELTWSACRNLWFHSGDLMREDEDGYLYFAGRKKERIRRRGENISSYDIESAVEQHPEMVEAAAIGVPAGDGEDDVYLVAVPRVKDGVTPAELSAWLAAKLPKFMLPRYIEFRVALPKTGSGKVEKYKLTENLNVAIAWDSQRAGASGASDAIGSSRN